MRFCRRISRRFQTAVGGCAADLRGTAAIEFALVVLPFFAVLIAIFEIGIVFLAQNELETATEKATRILLTGQVQQANVTQQQYLAKVCSYLPALFSCSGLMVDLSVATSFSNANTSTPTLVYDSHGQVTNNWNFQAGGANSILVLRVLYQFPVVPGLLNLNLSNLANGTRLLMATSVFQVEPYGVN